MAGITTAHVHDPGYAIGDAIETAIQTFDTVIQRLSHFTYEQRFIDLYVTASGLGQCLNFEVQGSGKIEGEFAASNQDAEVQLLIEGTLAAARQELTEEMRRLLAIRPRRRDATVGGIPVDSEYIVFIIDTSGSMQRFAWPLVLRKMPLTLG